MEKLKDFLEKWQWASLEDADKTLTESEQKIWELMKKNQDLESELATQKERLKIALEDFNEMLEENDKLASQLEEKSKRIKKLNLEAQRYYEDAYCNRQDIMQVADKAISLLAKALELACANHPAVCDEAMDCSKGVDCVECLVEHYKAQARKELQVE